jgi:serine protease AprX
MNRQRSRLRAGILLAVVAAMGIAGAGGPLAAPAQAQPVVVQAGSASAAAAAVRAAGGTVRSELGIVGGVAASVPPAGVASLHAKGFAVVPDSEAHLAADSFVPATADVQLAALNPGRRWDTDAGAGVAVALIDTGVADLPDLAGRLVRGPDLSGEDDGVDRYGHGTFMAGLIAGDGSAGLADGDAARHSGVAPGARLVSVKVAGRDGTTSLSRILAAIDWVVSHGKEHGIRVLSLSFGVDAPAGRGADPLSAAVEYAWASGITVVASSGNGGAGVVTSPGRDPWVITAGATDTHGTAATGDDTVPSWSGWQRRGPFTKPDVVAPGVSVISLRAPGSVVDEENPAARVGQDYFRGSGTSMATAMTAGAAAVLTAHHPDAVPDDVKGALVATAKPVAGSPAGAVDLAAADEARSDISWWQEHPLAGDAAGRPEHMPWAETGGWDSARWYSARWYGDNWDSARWYSARWYGDNWDSARWYSARWYSARWYSARWYGDNWDSARWYSARWYSARWYADGWDSARWYGDSWGPSAEWSGSRP